MAIITKEHSKKIGYKGKENLYGSTIKFMRESGEKDLCKAEEF